MICETSPERFEIKFDKTTITLSRSEIVGLLESWTNSTAFDIPRRLRRLNQAAKGFFFFYYDDDLGQFLVKDSEGYGTENHADPFQAIEKTERRYLTKEQMENVPERTRIEITPADTFSSKKKIQTKKDGEEEDNSTDKETCSEEKSEDTETDSKTISESTNTKANSRKSRVRTTHV